MIGNEQLERFQKAEKEVLSLLKDNQSIDIVSASLRLNIYLNKSGEWYAGFDLMGYPIGKNPDLPVLLKEYIYALTGRVIPKDEAIDSVFSGFVLDALIVALNETAERLRKVQVHN